MTQAARQLDITHAARDLAGWLSVPDAAQRMNCTPRHVRRLCVERWAPVGLAAEDADDCGAWKIDPAAHADLSRQPIELVVRPDFKALSPAQQTAAMQRAECVRAFRRAKVERDGTVKVWLPALLAELSKAYPDLGVSRTTLYRWNKEAGHPVDVAELVDWRGFANAERGGSGDPAAWRFFTEQFLDINRPSLADCWRRTAAWAEARGLAWCSVNSCRDQLNRRITLEVQAAHRDPKLYRSKFRPYIEQHPDRHAAGDCWVADHRPLDVLVRYEGKVYRPVITIWHDWKTRKVVGWTLSVAPNTDVILAALGRALRDPENLGPPRIVWMDNGKDFDSYAIKGATKKQRQRGSMRVEVDTAYFGGVLGALGIEPHFSLAHNPQGKARCERWFATMAAIFDKQFATYTGKDTVAKPDDLAERMRKRPGIVPTFDQVRSAVAEFVAWYNHNADHQMEDLRDAETQRKLSPAEAYAAWKAPAVLADDSALELCLMQRTQPVKVTRNGVRVKLPGCPARYYGQYDEAVRAKLGTDEKVQVFYDPDDTRLVQVRDEQLRLIAIVEPNGNTGIYGSPESRAALRAASKRKGDYERGIRLFKGNLDVASLTDDELIAQEAARIAAAKQAAAQPTAPKPDPDRPLRLVQTPFDGQADEVEADRKRRRARKAVGDGLAEQAVGAGRFTYRSRQPRDDDEPTQTAGGLFYRRRDGSHSDGSHSDGEDGA